MNNVVQLGDPDVIEILNERQATHGDFVAHANSTQSLKYAMRLGTNWGELLAYQIEALEMIQHKIGRILSGNPDHIDHWDDIAGYATLVARRLRELEGNRD